MEERWQREWICTFSWPTSSATTMQFRSGSDPFSSARKSRSLANEILLRQEWQNRITRPPRLVNKISKNGNVFWTASEISCQVFRRPPYHPSTGDRAPTWRDVYISTIFIGGGGIFFAATFTRASRYRAAIIWYSSYSRHATPRERFKRFPEDTAVSLPCRKIPPGGGGTLLFLMYESEIFSGMLRWKVEIFL